VFAAATYITKGIDFLTVGDCMDRTNEIASELVEKVREYFPKPIRHCFQYRCEAATNGASETIVIYGRFPNQLPQYDPKLLGLIGGVMTKSDKDSCVIQGKWQGLECQLQLRCAMLSAVCQ
jgi:hypothetical protein